MKAIYLSIKGKHLRKIESGEKNYEFRNYIPKEKIDILYVYETYPSSVLKYIIKIGNIIKYPDKIYKSGLKNEEFNKGNVSKYAYEIKELYELVNLIELSILKEKYRFYPPQSYAYDSRYQRLTNYLKKADKKQII